MTRFADMSDAMGEHHKRSIALVIRHPARPAELLLVQRPLADHEFPGIWGLPAATLRPEESWAEAGRRIGPEKLGVDLRIGSEVARGSQMRRSGTIEMRLYEASVAVGQHPAVPGTDTTVTQYNAWRWGEAELLRQGALRGSLCCQLQLDVTARAAPPE